MDPDPDPQHGQKLLFFRLVDHSVVCGSLVVNYLWVSLYGTCGCGRALSSPSHFWPSVDVVQLACVVNYLWLSLYLRLWQGVELSLALLAVS